MSKQKKKARKLSAERQSRKDCIARLKRDFLMSCKPVESEAVLMPEALFDSIKGFAHG